MIRRQRRGSKEVWVEVLEEMSCDSPRRRWGDKCPLLVEFTRRLQIDMERMSANPKNVFFSASVCPSAFSNESVSTCV